MRTASLTWSSPLPPTRSGVADYAFELLPELARYASVSVVEPPHWPGPRPPWAEKVGWLKPDAPPKALELVHLGNNPYHLWVLGRLRRWGGVVVLHDSVLHHLLVEEAASDGSWDRFASELEHAHGQAGAALARARAWGFAAPLDPFLFPARTSVLRFARGVVVHSRWAQEQLQQEVPQLPVVQVPLAVADLSGGDGGRLRQQLGWQKGELLAVHLGFLTPAKGLAEILQAMLIASRLRLPVRLLVVGEGREREQLAEGIAQLGLVERVRLLGYVGKEQLGQVLATADVGLVPRYPTAGETSAAALRFLAAGKPVIVCGYQQFLELPHQVALRIRPGREGLVDLVRWLGFLASHPRALAEAKERARRFWQEAGHPPDKAAEALVAAIAGLTERRGDRARKAGG